MTTVEKLLRRKDWSDCQTSLTAEQCHEYDVMTTVQELFRRRDWSDCQTSLTAEQYY